MTIYFYYFVSYLCNRILYVYALVCVFVCVKLMYFLFGNLYLIVNTIALIITANSGQLRSWSFSPTWRKIHPQAVIHRQ